MKTHTIIILFLFCFNIIQGQNSVDVYLIGGQSNATGQARVSNLPQSFTIEKDVMLYYSKYTNKGEESMQWQPLCPASESKDRFGVELSLGNRLQSLYPKRKIAIIKHGLSGSNLYAQWNPGNRPDEKRGGEYEKFIETVETGIKSLTEQGYRPLIRAMVWQQGEADARDVAGEKNNKSYASNLKNFIEQVRKDVKADNMLFVYGTVMPMAAERFPGRDSVKQAQRMVAESAESPYSVPHTILVEADDLQMLRSDFHSPNPKDDVHLGTFGILTLGERFAKAISTKIKF